MTEAEWLTCCEPGPMLEALGELASERKLRLYACACCRRLQEVLPGVWTPAALEVVERFADGRAHPHELRDAARHVGDSLDIARRRIDVETHGGTRRPRSARAFARMEAEFSVLNELFSVTRPVCRGRALGSDAARAMGSCAAIFEPRAAADAGDARDIVRDAIRAEEAAQADLLRDLFSDRFRFVVPDPAWFTPDVMALANTIYDGRAFEHMPILADALQDAGCDSDAVLNHCRDANQIHARGCWVVDLVLGKV